jgi:putative hydrolase of the HAD superfamily
MNLLMWDFDGTLGYRDGGMWAAALLELIFNEVPGSGVTAEQLRPHLQSGFPWHAPHRTHLELKSAKQWWAALDPLFEQAFRAVGIDPVQAGALARLVRQVYPDPARWRLFEDVEPTLGRLALQGWKHIVLSNHVPELGMILAHLGLEPYLAGVFSSADTGYEKPHPQAFRTVLAAFDRVQELWMIGDSFAVDVAGAESVGIPAILVRRRHQAARYFCHNLSQVQPILNRATEGPSRPQGA